MGDIPTGPGEPRNGIGVNDDGLVIALLNRTPIAGVERVAPRSRGSIVPELLACASLGLAVRAAGALARQDFEPFQLVMVQRSIVAVIAGDPGRPSKEVFPLVAPVMFTSSSLGDALVEAPRRTLFEQLVLAKDDWLNGQCQFHRHQWTRRQEISVLMAREDAATVSRTTIDVTSRTIDLEYESLTDGPSSISAAA